MSSAQGPPEPLHGEAGPPGGEAAAAALSARGCHALSAVVLTRALQAHDSDSLWYSAGLQHLLAGHYAQAASCLHACAPAYARLRPSLWLRLAECCLGVHSGDAAAALDRHAVRDVVGEAPYCHLLLARHAPQRGEAGLPPPESHPQPDLEGADADRPLSLSYAALCLSNAAAVLEQQPASEERLCTLVSLLQARSYLSLLRGSPQLALADARSVLALTPPPETRLLAGLYAAEAHLMLGELAAAAGHLHACLEDCGERERVGRGPDAPSGTARLDALQGDSARSAASVNLAAVKTAQGDLAGAHAHASSALSLQPDSLFALLALVHVHLQRGDKQRALELLRSHTLHG